MDLALGTDLALFAAAAAWALITLDLFALLDPLVSGASGVVFAELQAGAISLSIGDVLAFLITVAAAVLLARFITTVLEEDVYPRVRLGRGVAYALSTVVRYSTIPERGIEIPFPQRDLHLRSIAPELRNPPGPGGQGEPSA